MQLPCVYDINCYISEKKSIPLDDCYYHWRFIRCPIWDSCRSKGLDEPQNRSPDSSPNRSPDISNTNQEHKRATPNSPKPKLHLETPPNREKTDRNVGFQNQPTRPPFPLDPRLQTIKDLITIKPRNQPSGSLNKKQARKDITFEQSTRRDPSLFEHRQRKF